MKLAEAVLSISRLKTLSGGAVIIVLGLVFMASPQAEPNHKYKNIDVNASVRTSGLLLAQAKKKAEPSKKSTTPAAKVPTGRWSLNCPNFGPGKVSTCRVFQGVYIKKTRRLLLGVSVQAFPKRKQSVMLLRLPLGPYLPAGVVLRIDKNPSMKIQYQTCNAQACFASVKTRSRMLKLLRTGKKLTVTLQNLRRKDINIVVLLTGFDDAYRKMIAK